MTLGASAAVLRGAGGVASGGEPLPVGAIIGLANGYSVPSGWSAINPGKAIMCESAGSSGGTHSCGSTGSGGGGNHNTANGTRFMRDPGGSAAAAHSPNRNTKGNHTHTVSLSYTPSYSKVKLIKLSTEQLIPKGGLTWSAQTSLIGPASGYSTVNDQGGYLFGHSSDCSVTGSSSSASTSSSSFSHFHHDQGQAGSGGSFGPDSQSRPSSGPSHGHSTSASFSVSMMQYTLMCFMQSEESEACENQIIIFENGPAIPSGWAYCDGNNGTPNLHGRFIKQKTSTGNSSGDNTYSVSGSLSGAGSHNHNASKSGNEWQRSYSHDNNISHSHSYSKSGSYTPPYQQYRFLMRLP